MSKMFNTSDENLSSYRVYADGTVQSVEEESYSYMSDDFVIIRAFNEEHAYQVWECLEKKAFGRNL